MPISAEQKEVMETILRARQEEKKERLVLTAKRLPYAPLLEQATNNRPEKIRTVLDRAKRIASPYYMFQLVRKGDTEGDPSFPIFGTGLEGYQKKDYPISADEMLHNLLSVGKSMWRSAMKPYPYSHLTKSELSKFILEEKPNIQAWHTWTDIFAASLARLRAEALQSRSAQLYRGLLSNRVESLKPLEFRYIPNSPEEKVFQVFQVSGIPFVDSTYKPTNLSDEDQIYFDTALNIGKLGNPVLRQIRLENLL